MLRQGSGGIRKGLQWRPLKGFYFTGIVFIAVLVVVLSTSFFFSASQRDVNSLLTREAQASRFIHDVQEDELRFSTTVFEVLYNNSQENNRTVLEKKIAAVILAQWGAPVNVVIGNASGLNTLVTLVFRNYSLASSGNSTLNLTGANYSFIAGNAFFHVSRIFETFNASELCAFADFNPASPSYCSIDYGGFQSAKQLSTGLLWRLNITAGDCGEQAVNYTVLIADPDNFYSFFEPMPLKNRQSGFEHQARC